MESNNNFLESLTIEQQSQVFDLMAISNIQDQEVAAKLYIDSNYDLNTAVQKWLDRSSTGNRLTQSNTQIQPRPTRPQPSEIHQKYKEFYTKKTQIEEQKGIQDSVQQGVNTMLNGMKSLWNSYIPTGFRGETKGGEQFILLLKKNHPDLVKKLKWNLGTFEENIWSIKETGRPLLVYFHLNNKETNSILANLFKDKSTVDFMNSKFFQLGLLGNTEESQGTEKFIEPTHYPCFAFFRINLVEEITFMQFIKISAEMTSKQFYEALQDVHRNFWLKVAEENKAKEEVKRSIDMENRTRLGGNLLFSDNEFLQNPDENLVFFGIPGNSTSNTQRRQINPEEQARLEEDRILRQLQDEEFKEVERKILEQQQKQIENEAVRKEQTDKEQVTKLQEEETRQKKEAEKEALKIAKLESLPEEPAENESDVILIILRLPDGGRSERRFKISDRIQTLYDFIDTRDVQFDSSTIRYDLIQPMPFLCLSDKEKTFNDYFDGSNNEIIQIREHNE